MRHIYLLKILFIAAISITFVGCGREDLQNEVEIDTAMIEEIITDEAGLLSTKTLSIHTAEWWGGRVGAGYGAFSALLRQGEAFLNRSWQEQGKNYVFELNLTIFHWEELENQTLRQQVMLMAGQGYDIFILGSQSYWSYASSGFFVDIYELIDEASNISRDDFYTHILEAWEINGNLYAFPLAFNFDYVGINASLPQQFISRFAQHESISIFELINIYNDLQRENIVEAGNLLLGNWTPFIFPSSAMALAMVDFIDFENSQSNLNDRQFIAFLDALKEAFDITDITNPGVHINDIQRGIRYGYPAGHVFTMNSRDWRDRLFTFFPETEHALYLNFIPLSNKDGKLILNQTDGWDFHSWLTLSITHVADGPLAWEFIQHLITAGANAPSAHNMGRSVAIGGRQSFSTPIKRDYFLPHLRTALNHSLISYDNPDLLFDYLGIEHPLIMGEELLVMAAARINIDKDMSVVLAHHIHPDIYEDILLEFFLGSITAESMANQLHNRILLWLMEVG